MIGHTDIQLAMRAKLLALTVATTGVTSLSATATGYARVTGSFLTDGFAAGMELTPAGFAANPVDVIAFVSALAIVTKTPRAVESAAGGRSLTVALPTSRAWENVAYTPVSGVPYIEEQYIPGPSAIANDGFQGRLDLRPMYSPRIYVGENQGLGADGRYADAILRLFAPGTSIPLPTGAAGDSCIVLDKPAAFRGQRSAGVTPGWSTIPVTIPFRVLTTSSLP